MYGFALAFLCPLLTVEPKQLPVDVVEIHKRQLEFPLRIYPPRKGEVECVRHFVSADQGKTWKHTKDYKTTDQAMTFMAPRDGEYWFALQVILKSGERAPSKIEALTPGLKVYVNSARKPFKKPPSHADLQREVNELRETIRRLKQQIQELEKKHRIPN